MKTGGSTLTAAKVTLLALSRRRATLAILVLLPTAFYLARRGTPGQSVRSLLFGVSWAISTITYFATVEASTLRPRLSLTGWKAYRLEAGRIGGLVISGTVLATAFIVLVAADQDVRNLSGVAAALFAAVVTAVAFGEVVGRIVTKEMEGALTIFLFAGLQAVLNPFGTVAKFLPFWSSREIATYAVDGPSEGSLSNGVAHAVTTAAFCFVASAALRLLNRPSRNKLAA